MPRPRTTAVIAAALLAQACVTPTTRTQFDVTTALGPRVPSAPGAVTLTVAATGRALTITASAARQCRQARYEITRTVRTRGGTFKGPNAGTALLALVFWPVTVVGLAASTALAAGTGTGTTTSTNQRLIATTTSACPLALAALPLRVALPTGAILTVTTDGTGTAHVTIPDTEPPAGVATALVPNAPPAPVTYYVDHAACVAFRTAGLAASVAAPAGRIAALRALPDCAATTADERQLETAWTTLRRAVLAAAAGACDRAARLGAELAASGPATVDALLRADPAIAACAAAPPAAP
ncbi:MAG: hypothetical protein IPH44_17555 [Myxococcales bacterium]|nr:hypothetical protein [Myxococcales bacterium]